MELRRVILLLVLFALTVVPASATFPGKNGRIAFVQDVDLFTMNPDGSDVRQLTALTDGNSAFWENWSPDGKQIVFSEFPAPDFFGQLWMMNADGSNQHLLLNDPGFDDEAPSFSPDGGNIIFSRCAPLGGEFPCSIYRIQADGSGMTQLTPVRIELTDFEPAYSPDGSTVAFASFGRDGVIAAVYLMDADGANIRQVSDAELEGYSPNWSPDGRQLVLLTKCCNPEPANVVVMKRDGQQPRQITDDNGGTTVAGRSSWSPQGDAIVFRSTNFATGDNGIYIVNADGSGKRLLLKLRPSSGRRSVREAAHSRLLKNKKFGPGKMQIEDGGSLPRWGTAQ